MEYTLKEMDLEKLEKGTELHYPAQTAKPKPAPGKGNAIGRIDAISATTARSCGPTNSRRLGPARFCRQPVDS